MKNIIIHRSTNQDKEMKKTIIIIKKNQQNARYKVFGTVCIKEGEVLVWHLGASLGFPNLSSMSGDHG